MASNMLAIDFLNIDIWEILLYLLNFVILIVLMRVLLYKPIRKMVDARNKKFADIDEANKKLTAEMAGMKTKYEEMVANIKQEAALAGEQAVKIAEQRGQELIKMAQKQADELIARVEKEAVFEKDRLKREIKEQAADIVVDITGMLLKREISAADNKKLIDECLDEWESMT